MAVPVEFVGSRKKSDRRVTTVFAVDWDTMGPFSFPDPRDLLEVLVATHVKPSELPGKETRKQATLLASLPALLSDY